MGYARNNKREFCNIQHDFVASFIQIQKSNLGIMQIVPIENIKKAL